MSSPSPISVRLDQQVCFKLYAASNLITRLYRPLLNEMGLTYPQYLVMLVLWESAPQSVGGLGAKLDLDSGTLTPLLKRMEVAGLLERRRDSADERRVLVELTKSGQALESAAMRMAETLEREAILSTAELDALGATLSRLLGSLRNGPNPRPPTA